MVGLKIGDEFISEMICDWMFLEVLDCFVGSIFDIQIVYIIGLVIVEEMYFFKDWVDYYMIVNIFFLEEDEIWFCIGCMCLWKSKFVNCMCKLKCLFVSIVYVKRFLEQIVIVVKLEELVLLVGEIGIGKIMVVQQLVEFLGYKFIVVNLLQQSEVGDLLGGFKLVNVWNFVVFLKEEFEDLFLVIGILIIKNQKYFDQIVKCFVKG